MGGRNARESPINLKYSFEIGHEIFSSTQMQSGHFSINLFRSAAICPLFIYEYLFCV